MSSFDFLKKWIRDNGGFIHQDIHLDQTDLKIPKELIWQFGNHHLIDVQNEKEN